MSVARFALVLAAAAGFASAQLEVIAPGGPNLWWIANSANNIVWNCQESQVQNFTVLLANSDVNVLTAPIAIIGIENNFVCEQGLTGTQVNYTAATGYTISFANPLNQTDIYTTSSPFEIKAAGAVYPAASATPTDGTSSTSGGSGSSTGSASASATSGSSSSGARSLPRADMMGAAGAGALVAGALALLAL